MTTVAGQRRIVDTPFAPRRGPLPAEAFSLAELRNRVALEGRSERMLFHLVLVGTAGRGEIEVDFDRAVVEPGDVIHVRPGQVHRWLDTDAYEAQLVLLPDDALRAPGLATGVRRWRLTPGESGRFAAVVPMLHDELRHAQPAEQRDRALRALRDLLVVRLGLDRVHPTDPDADGRALPPAYVALRAELEARPAPVRPVAGIATALGYAPRTLSRACLVATGRTAKQLVDERVYLEARRLLVHTDSTVAAVAAALGFSEPTNFTKFFVRMSGRTPGAWRREAGAGSPDVGRQGARRT